MLLQAWLGPGVGGGYVDSQRKLPALLSMLPQRRMHTETAHWNKIINVKGVDLISEKAPFRHDASGRPRA